MRQIRVWILADGCQGQSGYQGASLFLPAGREAAARALQRARVPEGGGYQLVYSGWPDFLQKLFREQIPCSLEEADFLAGQISRMDERQLAALEGAVALRTEEAPGSPVTGKELINFTFNLNCYGFRPGVTDDRQLGAACIEGGLFESVDMLPDEVLELLDLKRVGQEKRREDQGAFTAKGYVFRNGEAFREIYDGSHLPEISEEQTEGWSQGMKPG